MRDSSNEGIIRAMFPGTNVDATLNFSLHWKLLVQGILLGFCVFWLFCNVHCTYSSSEKMYFSEGEFLLGSAAKLVKLVHIENQLRFTPRRSFPLTTLNFYTRQMLLIRQLGLINNFHYQTFWHQRLCWRQGVKMQNIVKDIITVPKYPWTTCGNI